jgi:peptidoglycan/xylan/chitin deacetylase (PgdA/CDA1 family)
MGVIARSILSTIPVGLLGSRWSPVLTYHTCYDQIPPDLDPIDNVRAARLYEHIEALKKTFRFVTVDEYCRARDRRGIAAVTFDDGNKSVIENALPALSSLSIPFTIFVNTVGMDGGVFWRLKVLRVIKMGLEAECESSFTDVRKLAGMSFHQYTKDCHNNSITVEREVDRFLRSKGVNHSGLSYLFDDPKYFVNHSLVWYGNHTARHYVLGSLDREQQHREMSETKNYLRRFPNINVSEVFAAPFGEERHMNTETFDVLRDLGYSYLLVNRGGVNRKVVNRHGIEVIERFSALDEDVGLLVKREAVRRLREFNPSL